MRLIRSREYKTMPWKNGGGTTTEIAVFPPGAGMEAFAWRLSMACVEREGPFSIFPGIDRSIAILEGEGLCLRVEGEDDVCLDNALAPFQVPGDVPACAEPIGGPVLDLNLMSRRECWRHALVRMPCVSGRATVARVGEWTAVLARGCAFALDHASRSIEVADGDTLLVDDGDPPSVDLDVTAERGGHLYIAHLWRR
jgi:hypothetical protein